MSTPPTAHPDDALAALSDTRAYDRPDDRPRHLKLDSDGTDIALTLPGPRILACRWALPLLSAESEILSHGSTLARRPHESTAVPTPVPPQAIADELQDRLTTLPDRPDAGQHYRDLRHYVREGSPAKVAEYLREVVRAVRLAAPKYRAPAAARKTRDTAPASAMERKRASRARRRDCEVWCAEDWLRVWVADVAPGTRIDARELYDEAAQFIGGDVEAYEDDAESWDNCAIPRPAVPGPKVFYEAADRILGPRKRAASGYIYIVPIPPIVADVVERVARLAWDETLTTIAEHNAAEEELAA